MDRIAIVGGSRLRGEIPISGAKNSAIKLMAAALLTDAPLRLTNMPRLADTRTLGRLLARLGAEVEEGEGAEGQETTLRTREIVSAIAPYDLVREMRASFNVLGPLLARARPANVSRPRGAPLGARPRADDLVREMRARPRSACPEATRSARAPWTTTSTLSPSWGPPSTSRAATCSPRRRGG